MYEKITLPNGVRIVYERLPYVRSVSCGVWVGAGSRHEKASENGASHFIEHMVFKGTASRTAAQMAEEMDAIGGQINAFTAKDCTCFYGRVLDEHLPKLTELLYDMLRFSEFSEECVESERSVIFEEIDMYEDSPDDLATERLASSVFRGSSLARPVLGTKRTLSKMTGESLRAYMGKRYRAQDMVIALSGSFADDDIRRLSEYFSYVQPSGNADKLKTSYTPSFTVRKKSIEQNHICIGFPGVSVSDSDRFAVQLMIEIIGGGMSSRLFQTLREERGLCYSVCSYGAAYTDCGIVTLYTGLGAASEPEALGVISDELKKLTDNGVTRDELARTCGQMKANILMGLESTSSRSSRMGRSELFLGEIPEPDELISSYEAVTCDDILRVSRNIFKADNLSLSAVGRVRHVEEYRECIKL